MALRAERPLRGPSSVWRTRQAHSEQPDLMLLDLMLPFKSGDEVLARCEAALRRSVGGARPRSMHRCGPLELDEQAHTATAGGRGAAAHRPDFITKFLGSCCLLCPAH